MNPKKLLFSESQRKHYIPHPSVGCFIDWRLNASPVIVWRSGPPVLHTWAAHTQVPRAGIPAPCHAIHGVSVVNVAKGYQIWRRGRTARPLLADAHWIINCSGVALLHRPGFTHWSSGAWWRSGEYYQGITVNSKNKSSGLFNKG